MYETTDAQVWTIGHQWFFSIARLGMWLNHAHRTLHSLNEMLDLLVLVLESSAGMYRVDVVTSADDKILCQIVVCLWGKAHMGSAHDFNILMYFLALRIGTRCLPVISLWVYPLYSQRWNSWQLYTFPGFRLADKFRKSLQSWRLGGDSWVLKLVTRLIRKKCVWVMFCFSLGCQKGRYAVTLGCEWQTWQTPCKLMGRGVKTHEGVVQPY